MFIAMNLSTPEQVQLGYVSATVVAHGEQVHLKVTMAVGESAPQHVHPWERLWLIDKAPLGADTPSGISAHG